MTVAPHLLRRFIIEKASGRTPRPEWAFYEPTLGAWIRTDETTARRHEHHQRIRIEGRAWCDVLGHQTSVADDLALQVFFLTLSGDDWPRLAAVAREHPARCLKEWTTSGKKIIAAVSDVASDVATSDVPGALDGWPEKRGEGQRFMLPR